MTKFNTLKSRKHEVTTETVTKVALSSNDDKRYLIKGSHQTLPFGHWALKVPPLIGLNLNEKNLFRKNTCFGKILCQILLTKNFV